MNAPDAPALRGRVPPLNERPRAFLALVLVLAAALSAVGAESDTEHWYDVTLGGSSMGYSHEWVETATDGNIITGTFTRMMVNRRDDIVRLEISERWLETPGGTPLEYPMSMYASDRETTLDLVIQGETASVRRAVGSDATTTELVIPAGLKFPGSPQR